MQAVRIKNRLSLHSVWDFTFKTSGSLSSGKVDHFQRGQHGSVSFGISNYVLGLYKYSYLSVQERRMMASVWAGLDIPESVRGLIGKMRLVGNTLRAGWKYRDFAPISMAKALAIQVKGFLFDRSPVL